jgi:hypothetical protein
MALGVRFTYRDERTRELRIGFFHRDTSRFVVTTLDGLIVTHFQTDEGVVAGYDLSTYRDD